ncbi:MAG: hypothetical protein ABSG70_01100 [Terriglobales bacterium]
MARPRGADKKSDSIDTFCKHCGKVLSTFLHQMEEHNAVVVCPACGKPHDVTPSQGGKAPASQR